jgi:Leishmanolysin/IPT/TIG domain
VNPGSHWEKRTFNGEFMIGTASRTAIISNMSLAFFADTGWYFPDFSKAEPLLWGAGLSMTDGCAFASPREHACVQSSWDGYKCTDADDTGCSPDRMGKAGCNMKTYTSSLPSYFAHFAQPGDTASERKGGGDELLDYCPVYKTYGNGWCIDKSNTDEPPTTVFDQGEKFCEHCRCFSSSLTPTNPLGAGAFSDICYETYCTGPGPNSLKLRLDGIWYPCNEGDTISIDQWGGELDCPDNTQLCKDAPVDQLWPEFESISPEKGGAGTEVTIKGRNFVYGMTVKIEQDCEDVQIESRTSLRCTLPDTAKWANPKYLVDTAYDVIVKDPTGQRHAVGYDSFTFRLALPTDSFVAIVDYIRENPGMGALFIGLTVLACAGACFFCYHERKQALKGGDDDDYNWD